ncbi:MAG: glycosyltransferase family 1 protein [Candidatus Buchananbacteria bacterium]
MKIGIDGRCLMNGSYSGVSWYAYNLLKQLFEIDNSSDYIIFGNSSHRAQLPNFERANAKNAVFKIPNKFFNLASFLLGKPKIDKMIGGIDVFWAPNLNFINVSANTKLILTVHDLSFLIFPQFFPIKSILWHKMILKTKLIQRADLIIADSNSTKADLVNLLKIEDNKIKVIYPGISSDYRKIESNDEGFIKVRNKYNLPERFILFLGTLEPRKNIESLIEAYKLIDTDVTLVIAGSGGWKNKDVYALAKQDSRIKMIGYVDESEKPYLYNLAQFLVYPSFYEGFGLPLIEAMACGCPVIAGANSSQSEIVENNGLLIDAYNTNDIKIGIEILLADEDLRVGYSKRGLETAKKFSWENSARELSDCFRK